jgi:iron complex outermembrane receptor protein
MPVFPATLTIRGAFPTFQYTQVNAAFTGADIMLIDTLAKHVAYSFKSSLLRSYNLTDKEYLILTPPAKIENTLSYSFSANGKLQKPYIQATLTSVMKKQKLPDSSDYAPAPDGYNLLGFSTGGSIKISGCMITIHFAIYNALNTVYREYLDRFRYFMHAPGRNFTIRLQIIFNR